MVAVEETKLRVNYFKGKDKSQWHCDIPTSQAVLYKSLYKNIDLKVYGIEKEIEYDKSRELIIDPVVLVYSTYLWGSSSDFGRGIVVDDSGCVYVTGCTWSSDFPTLKQNQVYQANQDAFITKLVLCTKTSSSQLNRTSLYFVAVSEGSQTGSQTFSVNISGGCSMQWTASCLENWIEVTPKNATGSALVTVSVDTRTLAPGTYTGTIFITYGSTSSVFVDGARPDVETAFPGYPFNYRAGWGYMLLTNFFPNGGSGTYTLSAAATDVEGNTVTLGAKTIFCDNSQCGQTFRHH